MQRYSRAAFLAVFLVLLWVPTLSARANRDDGWTLPARIIRFVESHLSPFLARGFDDYPVVPRP